MTRKINTRSSRKLSSGVKLLGIFFLVTLLLFCYAVAGEETITNSTVLMWVAIVLLIIELYLINLINKLFKTINKVEIKDNKVLYYTDRWVYISEREECLKISKRVNKIVFEFSNGLRLICVTKVFLFIPVNKNSVRDITNIFEIK